LAARIPARDFFILFNGFAGSVCIWLVAKGVGRSLKRVNANALAFLQDCPDWQRNAACRVYSISSLEGLTMFPSWLHQIAELACKPSKRGCRSQQPKKYQRRPQVECLEKS
jgi:hypothetical protein